MTGEKVKGKVEVVEVEVLYIAELIITMMTERRWMDVSRPSMSMRGDEDRHQPRLPLLMVSSSV